MYFTVLGKFQPELMWAVTKDVSLAISFDFKDYHSALFLFISKILDVRIRCEPTTATSNAIKPFGMKSTLT